MSDLLLSVLMLAAFLLGAGAVALWRRGEKQKAGLMATAGLVALANVLIWTLPG